MHVTDAVEVLTVALLRCGEEYMLLKRGEHKLFAPGKWTGLGGHVEENEHSRLRAAALREVEEEAGIRAEALREFILRRALLVNRPDRPLSVVLYYTGWLDDRVTPQCPEGSLHWKTAAEFDQLEIIDTTRQVLPALIAAMDSDAGGEEGPDIGITVFSRAGMFERILWSQPQNLPG